MIKIEENQMWRLLKEINGCQSIWELNQKLTDNPNLPNDYNGELVISFKIKHGRLSAYYKEVKSKSFLQKIFSKWATLNTVLHLKHLKLL